MMKGYFLLFVLWGIYGLIHSLFAATRIKHLWRRMFPGLDPYYRLIFVGFSVLLLMPILVYQSSLPQRFLFSQYYLLIFTGLVLSSLGIMVVLESFRHYDLKEFLGIRQLKGDTNSEAFKVSGPLAYVRHPLYSGSILALTGYFLFAPAIPNLIMGVSLTVYFIVGIRFEERKLVNEFGERYIRYREKVPALIPRINRKGNT